MGSQHVLQINRMINAVLWEYGGRSNTHQMQVLMDHCDAFPFPPCVVGFVTPFSKVSLYSSVFSAACFNWALSLWGRQWERCWVGNQQMFKIPVGSGQRGTWVSLMTNWHLRNSTVFTKHRNLGMALIKNRCVKYSQLELRGSNIWWGLESPPGARPKDLHTFF